MDGLLIAEQLGRLTGGLPAVRGAWRFPDDRTAVLPLAEGASLWLVASPHEPRIEVRLGGKSARAPGTGPTREEALPERTPLTPFQAQLAARATGDLIAAEQFALDRVVRLAFGEGHGFVPERPIGLIVELTGRNANLILVDQADRIVGAQRVVGRELNRHREVRPGALYDPPPPYDKLDPRTAAPAALRELLGGRPLRDVRKTIDGIGPRLYAALAARLAPLDEGEPLADVALDEAVVALTEMVAGPTATLSVVGTARPVAASASQALTARRAALAKRLAKVIQIAEKRVTDARLALRAAEDSGDLRAEADLLLARSSSFVHGGAVELLGFDSQPVVLTIDPTLDAAGNAAQRYDRARRREARAERAATRLPELGARVTELEKLLVVLTGADVEAMGKIESLLDAEQGQGGQQAAGATRKTSGRERSKTQLPGVRFVDPRGFEVLVGRSARENDAITFGVAKSRDLWLHVQAYQGAHVLVRSQNRELPFDTVLFAARLAAGFSRAKDSDNVAVDYTERKNVWRVKGAPAGAVNIAHQKTVYVTPARSDADAAGAEDL